MRELLWNACVLPALVLVSFTAACREAATPAGGPDAYVPGLGEMMSLQQMRHAKLWFAGQAQNWELASYEIDELGEGFDDVVKFHPTHKDSPVAPKDERGGGFFARSGWRLSGQAGGAVGAWSVPVRLA